MTLYVNAKCYESITTKHGAHMQNSSTPLVFPPFTKFNVIKDKMEWLSGYKLVIDSEIEKKKAALKKSI